MAVAGALFGFVKTPLKGSSTLRKEATAMTKSQQLRTIAKSPDDLSPPAIIGRLSLGLTDRVHLVADILYLAQQGCLTITEVPVRDSSGSDFRLERGKEVPKYEYQKQFLDHIFQGRSEVLLSDRNHKESIYDAAVTARDALTSELDHLGLIDVTRKQYHRLMAWGDKRLPRIWRICLPIGIVGLAAFFVIGRILRDMLDIPLWVLWAALIVACVGFLGTGLSWLLSALFKSIGRVRTKLTEAGLLEVKQWHILRREIVHCIRAKTISTEYSDDFAKYLPYAILLEVMFEWVETFTRAEKRVPIPRWYFPLTETQESFHSMLFCLYDAVMEDPRQARIRVTAPPPG